MIAYVIGGHQSRPASARDRDHRLLYDAGVVLSLDTQTRQIQPVAHWAEDSRPIGHAFKGGCLHEDQLVVCTERTVCWLNPSSGTVLRTHSDPAYNDLHDVRIIDGELWAVSTGAEGIVITDLETQARRFVTAEGPDELPAGDLRPLDLRPHRTHPNHLVDSPRGHWLTRLHPRDLAPLTPSVPTVVLGGERIHDGVWWKDRIWCTEVDGHVVTVDPDTGRVSRQDLCTSDRPRPSGWCRGLAVNESTLLAGFTRLRATRWRDHLAWARGALRGRQERTTHPTRIQSHNSQTGRFEWEIDLEPHGVHALFAIVWAQEP